MSDSLSNPLTRGGILGLVMFSLRKPIQGLSPLQRLLWPLIWLRLLMLKAQVRAAYGPGVPFAFEINAWGGVTLTRLPTEYREGLIPAHLVPPPAAAAGALSPALHRLAACLILPRQTPPRPVAAAVCPTSVLCMSRPRTLIPDTS
ncbi:MAG: hypothetical protein ACK46Q_13785 [Hyphomonas sp.]